MKRIICSIATFMSVCFVAWVGGLDFERGQEQAAALAVALYFGGIMFFFVDQGTRHD